MNKTFRSHSLATGALALMLLTMASTGALSQGKPAAPPPKPGGAPAAGAVPAPKILVIDRNVIIRVSKAGQDIVRQANGLMQSAQSEFRAEGQGLQKEGRALQQQVAILEPDVKADKVRDFQGTQAAFERKVVARQDRIQGGIFKARQHIDQALGPFPQETIPEPGPTL